MSTLKREQFEASAKATAKATAAKQAELSAPPAPKVVDTAARPFRFSRRGLISEAEQVRRHFVLNVDAGVPYERVLQPDAYRSIADAMRPGDWVELRFEPSLSEWALLMVAALVPDGAQVVEIIHKTFDVKQAASIEELAGFTTEQIGINEWAIIREADGHRMPGSHPTLEAARSEITRMKPQFQGRGWARNS
jgi:hypothetical protein